MSSLLEGLLADWLSAWFGFLSLLLNAVPSCLVGNAPFERQWLRSWCCSSLSGTGRPWGYLHMLGHLIVDLPCQVTHLASWVFLLMSFSWKWLKVYVFSSTSYKGLILGREQIILLNAHHFILMSFLLTDIRIPGFSWQNIHSPNLFLPFHLLHLKKKNSLR